MSTQSCQGETQGAIKFDAYLSVGQAIYDSKFKEAPYAIVVKIGTPDANGFSTIRENNHGVRMNICFGCQIEVPRGFVACPLCRVFFILRDRKTGLQFSPVKIIYRHKLAE